MVQPDVIVIIQEAALQPCTQTVNLFFIFEKHTVLAFNLKNVCRGENNTDPAF